MSITAPGCYTTDGQPVTVDGAWVLIKPLNYEGRTQPSPAQAAAKVLAAIATLPKQPSIL
jgi:hypothetical protein